VTRYVRSRRRHDRVFQGAFARMCSFQRGTSRIVGIQEIQCMSIRVYQCILFTSKLTFGESKRDNFRALATDQGSPTCPSPQDCDCVHTRIER
jgi:hypothetical protein